MTVPDHRAVAEHGEPCRVHTVGGDRRVHRRSDVGGREAEHLAAAVAANHHALDAVRPAQRLGGGDDVARVDAGPDVGGRERDGFVPVVLGHQGHALDREAEPLPRLAQQADVACGLLAEGEVLPDHDLDDMQVLDQQLVDVALGGQLHEVRGERHHQEDVDAQFLDQLGAAGQGGQLRGVAAGEDDFHRMRVERHQHRRHTTRPGRLDGVVDQFGMSAVHPVEHADRDDTSAPVRGDLILPPPALHSRKPTAPGEARRLHIPRSGDHCLNFVSVSPNGDPRDLTAVAQDYLKVIWTAQEWSLEKVSTKMLAERIGVSASTASESIRKLADQGLVDHEKYGAVTLTDAGRRAALAMVRRHRLMETFLVRMLGYSWDEVHDEAEVLEHAVSDRMLDRIDAKLGYPKRDPHGDPIPAADGHVPTPDARQLSVCRDGETGTVARISDADPEMLRYFETVGITLDSRLMVLARRDFAGMISVAIKSADARENDPGTTVELGSPAAEAIWVVA